MIYSADLLVLEADWAYRLPAGAMPMAKNLEARFVELVHRIARDPKTFAHSDTRLDNLFFTRNGSTDVAFIDFQLSLRQRGAADIDEKATGVGARLVPLLDVEGVVDEELPAVDEL